MLAAACHRPAGVNGLPDSAALCACAAAAQVWTENAETKEAGGVYLFDTRENAQAYITMHEASGAVKHDCGTAGCVGCLRRGSACSQEGSAPLVGCRRSCVHLLRRRGSRALACLS